MPVNALIIGAAKAGTTSLFSTLAEHPQVCPASVKETRFFSDDARFARGMAWYRREYFGHAAGQPVWLDASPAYLTWSDKVAPRVAAAAAAGELAPRFIAILRDPVRRAYSHYCHRVRLGHETLSFEEAIDREEERLRAAWDELSTHGNGRYGYLRASCYATRLRPWVEAFDRQQFCFLLQEDLAPPVVAETLQRVLAFLRIDPIAMPALHVNAPTRARLPGLTPIYWGLKRTSLQRLYVGLVPRRWRTAILEAMFPPASYPPLAADVERRLRERLAGEVRACAAMIDRDLSHWLPA